MEPFVLFYPVGEWTQTHIFSSLLKYVSLTLYIHREGKNNESFLVVFRKRRGERERVEGERKGPAIRTERHKKYTVDQEQSEHSEEPSSCTDAREEKTVPAAIMRTAKVRELREFAAKRT